MGLRSVVEKKIKQSRLSSLDKELERISKLLRFTIGTDDLNDNHSFFKWFKKYLKKKDNFKYFITPPDNY